MMQKINERFPKKHPDKYFHLLAGVRGDVEASIKCSSEPCMFYLQIHLIAQKRVAKFSVTTV